MKKTSIEIENKIIEMSPNYCRNEIAKILNVTHKVVTRVGNEQNLKFKKPYNKRYSKELENEMLDLYKKGHNTKYISEKFNLPHSSVSRAIKRAGNLLIPKNMLNITIDDEKEICSLYQKGFSTCDIAKMFKDKIKCDHTVANILRKNNVQVKKAGYKSIVLNNRFFKTIDNQDKAYFLGFIYADGNVRKAKDGSYIFQMMLKKEDSYILETLNNLLQCKLTVKDLKNRTIKYVDKKLYYRKNSNSFKNYNTVSEEISIHILNKELFEDLNNLGVHERKTFNLKFPTKEQVPNEYIRHFIRGYFDGDGSAVTSKRGCPRIVFYGQKNFLKGIKKVLENELNVNTVKIFDKKL